MYRHHSFGSVGSCAEQSTAKCRQMGSGFALHRSACVLFRGMGPGWRADMDVSVRAQQWGVGGGVKEKSC